MPPPPLASDASLAVLAFLRFGHILDFDFFLVFIVVSQTRRAEDPAPAEPRRLQTTRLLRRRPRPHPLHHRPLFVVAFRVFVIEVLIIIVVG